MNTYEAITYSLYTNTKDLSYKNGIAIDYLVNNQLTTEASVSYECHFPLRSY